MTERKWSELLPHLRTVVIAGVALSLLGATPAAAVQVTNSSVASTAATEPQLAAEPGLFVTNGDRVHISSSPPAAVSAHGWWVKGTTKATRAKVEIWIEAWTGSRWRVVAHGSKTVYSGGGSANRAAARMVCAAGPVAGNSTYRSRIDVDLIGYADSNEQAITASVAIRCLPITTAA
jgi:hypothetical protein